MSLEVEVEKRGWEWTRREKMEEGWEKRKWEKRESACCGANIGIWWPAPLTEAKVRPPSFSSTHPPTSIPSNQALYSLVTFSFNSSKLYLVDNIGTLPSVSPLTHQITCQNINYNHNYIMKTKFSKLIQMHTYTSKYVNLHLTVSELVATLWLGSHSISELYRFIIKQMILL